MDATLENVKHTIYLLKWLVDREEGEMITTTDYKRNSVDTGNAGTEPDLYAAIDDVKSVTGIKLVWEKGTSIVHYIEEE